MTFQHDPSRRWAAHAVQAILQVTTESSGNFRRDSITRFLNDEELGPAIRDLVKGDKLRCAVAFWGTGAAEALFDLAKVPVNARLICDISMGGTNPRELAALGAPMNPNLVHMRGLHAKVYLSDRGLITASANASNNGIGFLEVAGLIEAGTFHEPSSEAYKSAGEWFERIWGQSNEMDPAALAAAKEAWRRRKAGDRRVPRAANPKSLIDQVLADPESFRGVGFVFSSGTSTSKHLEEATAALIEHDDSLDVSLLPKAARKALTRWPLGNVFSDWAAQDVSAWPQRFVCAHEGARGGMTYWFYERSYSTLVDPERGVVLAIQSGGLRRELGFQHGRKTMVETDEKRLRAIFQEIGEGGHRLFENGTRLSAFLSDLELPG